MCTKPKPTSPAPDGGRPWARQVPLEQPSPRRQPGLLKGRLHLPPSEELLAPLPAEELEAMEASGFL